MLTGIHILLTYTCNYECDHCFLYCSPKSAGTFTLAGIRELLSEAQKLKTVKSIYLEGGEPFLFYPLMLKSLELAREKGFKTGIVTNSYWATSEEDALLWLRPVAGSGIGDLSLSDDAFHHGEGEENPARTAYSAALKCKIPVRSICIEKPLEFSGTGNKGESVTDGSAIIKGRAADTLAKGLPAKPAKSFCECSREELVLPKRVHIDPFGNVHICQGISIGNMFRKPLSEIIFSYKAEEHPICGPLVKGGPFLLAKTYGIDWDREFVDECHLCYLTRKTLIDRFPDCLNPKSVYGI